MWWLGAGSCRHDRPVQRDREGDAVGERTLQLLYSPWRSLGKLSSHPPTPPLTLLSSVRLQAGRQVDLQVLHSTAQALQYPRICNLSKENNKKNTSQYLNESKVLRDGTERRGLCENTTGQSVGEKELDAPIRGRA